jgi:hypothetical protein
VLKAVAFSDFSTIFGRQFLIGFMVPPLAGLFLLSQFLSDSWLPHGYSTSTSGTQVIIVGAVAVFIGLLLSGFQYPLVRLLEGYPFERLQHKRFVGPLYQQRMRRWQNEFDSLTDTLKKPPGRERTQAALRLHRCFPAKRESVLPTEFGNVVRSFETHSRNRYCIDGITIWPRIEMLLTEQEKQQFDYASTDVMFFLNIQVLVIPVGLALATNAATQADNTPAAVVRGALILLATAVVCVLAWRASIGAARRWGSPVRAAIDLHRLELYERLGVKTPTTFEEDRRIGLAVSRLLLYAEPLPDNCRKPVTTKEDEDDE